MAYASDSNRLTTLNGSTQPLDAAGNHTQVNNQRIVYDDQGRLSEVYQASIYKVADYKYNALGQLIVKRVFDMGSQTVIATTSYLYDQNGNLIGQTFYNEKGLKISGQYWFWLGSMPLAQLTANFSDVGYVSSSKLIYLHPDHLNTPRLATDSTQSLLWRWDSDAYGVGTPNEDVDGDGKATSVPLRFPGQIYDAQTQLSYNYYRNYNPATGRYVQSDPIGIEGGVNTYGYVSGNPLVRTDEFGLSEINLGQGYTGRIDSYNYRGTSSFEIHVYGPNGAEVGVVGQDGNWINKHGHRGAPEGVPAEVCNSARGNVVDQLRGRGILPEKGTVDIKGQTFESFMPKGYAPRSIGVLTFIDVILQSYIQSRECQTCE